MSYTGFFNIYIYNNTLKHKYYNFLLQGSPYKTLSNQSNLKQIKNPPKKEKKKKSNSDKLVLSYYIVAWLNLQQLFFVYGNMLNYENVRYE